MARTGRLLKELASMAYRKKMLQQKYIKLSEELANIRQELICSPYHIITTKKEMGCLAEIADEEDKIVRKIVVSSEEISQENLEAIIKIANDAGFEILQGGQISSGHQCSIHPNITKYQPNNTTSCDSSQLPLLSEYEQNNNNNCYSSPVVMEDRLSQLPDEILVSILSQLTLREAVLTSSLSSRWRYLWMNVTCLNFDVISNMAWNHSDFCQKERLRHINWINHVLDLHSSHTLEEFSVCFPFEDSFKCEIDKWLKFASSKKVQRLNLSLLMESGRYSIPIELLSQGSSDASLFGFGALKSLTLDSIDVCSQVAEIFLSNCPLLEQLYIRSSRVLKHLEIGPSLKLKHLEIYQCEIDYLEMCNANLVSFCFKGSEETKLCLENVSLVVNLQIEFYNESLPRFIDLITAKFTQLLKLSLEVSSHQLRDLDFDHSFPKFNNLKWLILTFVGAYDCSLLGVAPLLQASPFLEMFEIKIEWSDTRVFGGNILLLTKQNPYQHLKVVKYGGYLGGIADEEFITYLVRKSIVLERFILSPCDYSSYSRDKSSKVERRARSRAWRQKGNFPNKSSW